jgi:adenylylsulfate kinase
MSDTAPENIHPIFESILRREDKEKLLGQRGKVIWLYGLSGSGKSTLANALERRLHEAGRFTQILDGDNIRSGLNSNLGFSDEDRQENIRRIAEVAKLFLNAGAITIASFITPKKALRDAARSIVGADDFLEIYIECRFETCEQRDVKGLYAKAAAGGVKQFTGRDSSFEPPEKADLIVNTDNASLEESLQTLLNFVNENIGTTTTAS